LCPLKRDARDCGVGDVGESRSAGRAGVRARQRRGFYYGPAANRKGAARLLRPLTDTRGVPC
jgi:hypothetical protein